MTEKPKMILRVGLLGENNIGTIKLAERFHLAEVSPGLLNDLREAIVVPLRWREKVEKQNIDECLRLFDIWLDRAMDNFSSENLIKAVLLDIPWDYAYLLPGIQDIVVRKGLIPIYVFDRNNPGRKIIIPCGTLDDISACLKY